MESRHIRTRFLRELSYCFGYAGIAARQSLMLAIATDLVAYRCDGCESGRRGLCGRESRLTAILETHGETHAWAKFAEFVIKIRRGVGNAIERL